MKNPVNLLHTRQVGQKGFTLMEILVVVMILSIMMMICMPMYQNYSVRTKVSGEIPLMRPVMVTLKEKYARYNEWPKTNAEAGAKEPGHYRGKYLTSVEVSDNPREGTMTLTYDTDKLPVLLGTNTLVFYPSNSKSSSNWKCDQGTLPDKYRTANCQ